MAKKEVFDFYDRTTLKSYNLDRSMQYQLNILGNLDAFTRQHSENVAAITCRLCENLHLPKGFTEYCTVCAYLHDIGKQFIPHDILQKPSRLTDEEFEIMKTHTTIGYKICMDDLKLRPYAAGPLYHHEALNGTGYPQGLTAKDIPLEARIIRVADEYDAMVSKRQYKTHIGIVDTMQYLINESRPVLSAIQLLVKDTHPLDDSDPNQKNVKNPKYGKVEPPIVKALIKVVIEDTEYEISCVMDYVKSVKEEVKRLEQVEKYDKKRLATSNERKKKYYLEGMKAYLVDKETPENYQDFLTSYKEIVEKDEFRIKNLFEETKKMKKLKGQAG